MSQQQSTAIRSLFWPGFALGFLLLASISCGGMVAALGLSGISLSDLQAGGSAWTPPPTTPTPVGILSESQVNPAEPAVVEGLFSAGDTVHNATNSRVNIRRTPGYLGKPANDVLAQLQPGDAMTILGDAAGADNLTWREIRYVAPNGSVTEGWVAEATASGVVILRRP